MEQVIKMVYGWYDIMIVSFDHTNNHYLYSVWKCTWVLIYSSNEMLICNPYSYDYKFEPFQ